MDASEIFVAFNSGATGAEVANVEAAFAEVGLDAAVSTQPYSLVASGGEIVDGFVIVTTSGVTLFLSAFLKKAGTDAVGALKRWVGSMRSARTSDNQRLEVIIRGENGGPDVVIGPDTPEGALGDLLTSDLPPAPSGAIIYDPDQGRWRDADS
ncbi:MAG: hypothetical protein GY708_23775 [Actinomycetia bacterium]|nr:hypothetical protein [Actinomycetes bacterium]